MSGSRTFAALAAVFASACATPAPPHPPATAVSFEVRSWGYVQERWTISANGEAQLEQPPPGAQFGAEPEMQRLTVTTADFERVRAAMQPAEPLIGTEIPCENMVTDAPYGSVRWRRGDGREDTVSFNTGCGTSPQIDRLFEATRAADIAFHEVTGTTN